MTDPARRPAASLFEHLGLRIRPGDGGGVRVEMPVRPDLCGPGGAVQGGIIATLVDVAGAAAGAQALADPSVLTTELTVHYLAPGRHGPIRADGRTLRAGRGRAVAEVRISDLGADDRLVAVGLVSLQGRPSRSGRAESAAGSAG